MSGRLQFSRMALLDLLPILPSQTVIGDGGARAPVARNNARSEWAASLLKFGRMARFRGYGRVGGALAGAAWSLAPDLRAARREVLRHRPRAAGDVPHLGSVAIGTTGLCNASCLSCPTGKASTAHVPRTPMAMPLFRKIIDGIEEEGVDIRHMIGFGLFGDGLLDPHVVERARYVREKLPDVLLSVNTNAAAYNSARHKALRDHVSVIALHCESLTPETFDRLMAPLRARNVFAKYERLLDDFPGRVRVSVPVSRMNLHELEAMRAWFLARGAHVVAFDPLSSRCSPDRTVFDALALAPQPIRCAPEVMTDLIVDSDGRVLACCQDFERIEPIGDLSRAGFRETMLGVARAQFRQRLAEGRHAEVATCSRCHGDVRSANFPFDQLADIAAG
ncbi:hypothetical protein HL653_12690 [Sphingomonas sp. AP4-R1]|uniref:radical SAM/SPASM domain-containing protein n=1 Tax=Sphingomonas sp. AP4-R1 TaxID=2735134 RepID=UPI00149346FB|nr:radical SAM/SPASM domain-containing protein [Sphingomonas sp. AP4-R1]QJU58506.1 hypothetical protein HL653_12690 [Sphingomonas sp. AP4-R1]